MAKTRTRNNGGEVKTWPQYGNELIRNRTAPVILGAGGSDTDELRQAFAGSDYVVAGDVIRWRPYWAPLFEDSPAVYVFLPTDDALIARTGDVAGVMNQIDRREQTRQQMRLALGDKLRVVELPDGTPDLLTYTMGGGDMRTLLDQADEAHAEQQAAAQAAAAHSEPVFSENTLDPGEGFLHDYVEALRDFTEADPAFHRARARVLVAAAASRCRIAGSGEKLSAFVMNIAGSGTGKSTADKPARRLLGRLAEEMRKRPALADHAPIVIGSGVTAEGLEDLVYRRSNIVQFVDEQRREIDSGNKQFNADLGSLKTILHNGVADKRLRVKSGKNGEVDDFETESTEVSLSVIANSTPVWLRSLTRADLASGEYARYQLFFSTQSVSERDIAWPEDMTPEVETELLRQLWAIASKASGEIDFSAEARLVFEDWYVGWKRRLRDDAQLAELLGPTWRRAQSEVKKIAALMEISVDPRENAVVREEFMRRAIDSVDAQLELFLGQSTGDDKLFGDPAEVMLGALRRRLRQGPASLVDLWQSSGLSRAGEVRTLVELLVEAGEVARVEDGSRVAYVAAHC